MALAIIGLGFYGCKKDEYESRINELVIKDMTFSSNASSETQTFKNEDMSNYTISSSDDSWCHAVILKESSQIRVTVDENTTYDQREAVVTISDVIETSLSRTFKVTQAQKDALIISEEYKEFKSLSSEAQQIRIEVKSNVPYSVKIHEKCEDWISLASNANTRGLVSSTVVLDISKNNSGGGRTGKVYFINDNNPNDKDSISINQVFTKIFNINPKSFTIDELGGVLEVNVNANIGCDVYEQADWIKKLDIKDIDDENFIWRLGVDPFTEKKNSRVGYVLFQNDTEKVQVSITQNRTLFIEESEIRLLVGERMSVELNNTGDYEVTWTSSNEKVARVTEQGVVVGISDGMAIITVTSADGKYSDNVTVQVDAASEAKLDDSWSKVSSDGLVTSVTITLKNQDSREIYLKKDGGTFYRVTVDGEETKTEAIGSDSGDVYVGSGKTHQVSFSGIAPSEPSATATYSYYMEWTYIVDNKEFIYIAEEK